MNRQFDELARGLAQSVTRRAALKQIGVGLAGIALACLGLTGCATAPRPIFTTIDYPGAVFTDGVDINNFGDIVGHYIDAAETDHGYLLQRGRFTTIDFPGADGGHAHGINSGGAIVGQYFTGERYHGYLLKEGVYSRIDVPGAQDTRANGINTAGDIVGSYNTGGKEHGFLLRGAAFSTIDFPGADYAEAWRINDHGQIVGRYQNGNGAFHIYLLTISTWTFVSIDYPGAAHTAAGDFSPIGGFNNHGDIASDYCSSLICEVETTGALHGFLLSGGSFTSLDMPGAAGTVAFGINDHGAIVGGYTDASFRVHGYLRTPGNSPPKDRKARRQRVSAD